MFKIYAKPKQSRIIRNFPKIISKNYYKNIRVPK